MGMWVHFSAEDTGVQLACEYRFLQRAEEGTGHVSVNSCRGQWWAVEMAVQVLAEAQSRQ